MMKQPPCEVADVVRVHGKQFGEQYGQLLDSNTWKVLHAIENCRTAILGGHVDACDHCGHLVISYNSCRNRHCPKCQGSAREKWLADRNAEILPIPYFHAVFTLPQQLAPLALQNKGVVYGILFRAVSETLLEVAADPKHLGAQIGFITVLHTWGQNLQHHPHLHCVISGGGLSPDRARWVHSRDRFLLPVKILSRVFRGKFLALLKKAFRKGKLQFQGRLSELGKPSGFDVLLDQMYSRDWVVYSKAPFGDPQHVLRYLGNYTHRVAISNHRILSVADGNVTFRWKDYAHGSEQKRMTLTGCEFLRRFFLHVLPKGFVRIRQYGFLANRQRAKLLTICQHLLSADVTPAIVDAGKTESTQTTDSLLRCPACKTGYLRTVERLPSYIRSGFCRAIPSKDSS